MSVNEKATVKERKRFIKESGNYLTPFERFTHKVLSVFYVSIFWLVTPFILLAFIIDGFNFSVLAFLGLIWFVFIPIYKQNEKRLEVQIKNRMEQEQVERTDSPAGQRIKEEMEVLYEAPAISINMGSNSFFITLCSIFLTGLFVWSHGWDHSITRFFLYLSIALLVFSFWFPYSPFVKRQVKVSEDKVKVGKKLLYYREIKQVVCRSNGVSVEFHLTHTNEPTKVRMENEYQLKTRDFLREWCEKADIPFIEEPS